MSQPTRRKLLSDANSEGPGESVKTRAHPQYAVFLTVEGIDPAVDTLEFRLEASPDDTHYAPIDSAAPDIDDLFFLDQSNLTQSEADANVYVAHLSQHNQLIEYVRPNIVTYDGTFTVDADLYLSGWTQRGASFNYLDNV